MADRTDQANGFHTDQANGFHTDQANTPSVDLKQIDDNIPAIDKSKGRTV